MRIIDVFDKGLGMVVGAFTALLIPVLTIPMAYYLFAKNMKEINQNWAVTILITATVGSVMALFSAGLALVFTGFSFLYGIKIGIEEGLKGAALLPYNIFGKMNSTMAENSPRPASFETSPIIYILSTVLQFGVLGGFSFEEVFIKPVVLLHPREREREELTRRHDELMQQAEQIGEQSAALQRLLANRAEILNNPASEAIRARNAALLASFEPPQESKKNNALLTEEEIAKFKIKVNDIKDKKERAKRTQELTAYLNAIASECPITREPINDPVTVVEHGTSRVYENSALRAWIEEENKKSVDAGDPQSRTALESLAIFNGYPKFVTAFVSYVREPEKRRQARLKLFDPKHTEPASTPDTPSTVNTIKKSGNGTS